MRYDERTWDDVLRESKISDSIRGSYARTDPDYIDNVDRRNLEIYAKLAGTDRGVFLKGLPRDERRALEKKFQQIDVFRHASPEELTSKRPSGTLRTEILILNREVAAYFARNPSKLHEVTPRQFEHLIAGILKDMGCDVELMKATRDGGRDIIAAFTTQFGKLLSIIQCKRYRHDNCVGLDVVERFLWTIEHKDRASCGIIVTTSYFSPDAQARAKEFEWKLKLRDLQGVQEWLGAYGTWIKDDSSQLWMPHGVRQPKQT